MFRRQLLSLAVAGVVASSALLTGCGGDKAAEIKVGATAGPHAAIVNEAAKVAQKDGLKVTVVEFTDYISPNRALADKSLDANVYQHGPFLANFNKNQGTDLQKIADAVVQPMGFYSNKIHSLETIPEGATISIPNDPTNGGRALLLIQASGLIKLKDGVTGNTATPADIVENPKNIKVVELEAAQLPRSLDDVDIAAIPMNYVISANLSPEKQGFYFESREAPFALMIIAARPDNAKDVNIQKFVKAYQSPEVKEFIDKTFKGAVKAAW
ncbi:MAG: MetQ/NlpA family ABC transporter substrate-binding protein [Sutterellaceae bacterium]|nr:MetQ/NlpA family ABC transporter substrate-binding protein [Sutterellaceae bacterium]